MNTKEKFKEFAAKKILYSIKETKKRLGQQRRSYNFKPREYEDVSSHGSLLNKESLVSSFTLSSNSTRTNYLLITHTHTFNKKESYYSSSMDEKQSPASESEKVRSVNIQTTR